MTSGKRGNTGKHQALARPKGSTGKQAALKKPTGSTGKQAALARPRGSTGKHAVQAKPKPKLSEAQVEKLRHFIAGDITLATLEGMPKETQYEIAKIGFTHWKSGRLDKAKEIYEGLTALDPYDAYFHAMLGSIAQRGEDYVGAEAAYNRALEINPYSVPALANRGELRLMRGDLAGAADDFKKAISNDPEGKDPTAARTRTLAASLRARLAATTNASAVQKAAKTGGAKR